MNAFAGMQVPEELLGRRAPGEQRCPRDRVLALEFERVETRGAKIFAQRTGPRIADDIARTGHRICRHGQSARHRLQQHQTECVGLAGEHEHIGRGIHLGELFAVEQAEIVQPRDISRGWSRAPGPCPPPTSIPAGRARETPRRSSRPRRDRRTGRWAARCSADWTPADGRCPCPRRATRAARVRSHSRPGHRRPPGSAPSPRVTAPWKRRSQA